MSFLENQVYLWQAFTLIMSCFCGSALVDGRGMAAVVGKSQREGWNGFDWDANVQGNDKDE